MLTDVSARLRREIRVYQAALTHPATPPVARWLLRAAIAYTLTPIDLIPDFIPVLGHLDDAIIVPGLVVLAVRLIPRDALEECRAQAASVPAEGFVRTVASSSRLQGIEAQYSSDHGADQSRFPSIGAAGDCGHVLDRSRDEA